MFGPSRRWLHLSGVGCLLALLLALGVPRLLELGARRAAEGRGVALEVERVSLGWGSVWLLGVTLKHKDLPSVDVGLHSVELRVGFAGLREIVARGGEVSVTGPLEQLARELSALKRQPSTGSESARAGRTVRAEGLHLSAKPSPDAVVHVWGVSLERRDSTLQFAADLVRVHAASLELESQMAQGNLSSPDWQIRQLGANHTTVRIKGSPPAPTAQPSGPSGGKADAAPAEPRFGFGLDAQRPERLRRLWTGALGLVNRRLPGSAKLELNEVYLQWVHEGSQLNLGPLKAQLVRGADDLTVELSRAAVARAIPLSLRLSSPIAPGPARVTLQAGPVSLAELGVREGDLGLRDVAAARIRLDVQAELSEDRSELSGNAEGALENLSWFHERVSALPLSHLNLSWSGQGALATDGSRLSLSPSRLGLGAVQLEARGLLEQQPGRIALHAELSMTRASCQAMFDSLPAGLVPLLAGTRLSGSFSWKASLNFDSDEPARTDSKWRMQNGCTLDVPPQASVEQFREPFVRTVSDENGEPRLAESGPGSNDWVSLTEISPYLEAAVLTTEDGGFWTHHGFDQGAIEGSIESNLQAQRFVRGASTITMQLAKNLYLTREKLLSRKVQEALLTMLLEQELAKGEILELYFNVIEFGPNVYGIRAASEYYFNSKPHELSIAQCFFLASILPRPTAQRFAADGSLTPSWAELVRRLMRIAHQRGRLNAQELETGLAQHVEFGVPNLLPDGPVDPDASDWLQRAEDPWNL